MPRDVPPGWHFGVQWLYALVVVPFVTDIIETGRLPAAPREWITEVVVGLVIAALVRRMHRQHLAVLALARTDALTGLWNRRSFEDTVADECARARRSGQPLSLVYIDIDHFKRINDRDGHQRGDQILRQVAASIAEAARARVDRGFRLGGDEFAMLLPGSTAGQSEAVVTRIRDHCARVDPVWHRGDLALSAGIVEFDHSEAAAAWVQRADAEMYRQKTAHR
jgi:diguanylate cyclase (GGDEF)-like protein